MDTATIVWIAKEGAERPRADDPALVEWGRARGVRLATPGSEETRTIPIDHSIGDRVEEDLERARDASSALDADLAERFLARAEALVREHPELPESAWLMAEVLRGWSVRWARVPPREPARAEAAWRRARGLDGGRRAGLGEEAAATADAEVPFVLSLDGEGEAWIDGARVAAGPLRRTTGEHHLSLRRAGRLVWAGWIDVTDGATVRVAVPAPPSCSGEELSKVTVLGETIRAEGVRCERIVARPGAHDGVVDVAMCRGNRCGPLLVWSVPGTEPWLPDARPHPRSSWPAWATWTLVGVGAASVTATILGLAGVFQQNRTDTPFTFGGLELKSEPRARSPR